MHSPRQLFIVAGLLLMVFTVQAAQPIALQQQSYSDVQRQFTLLFPGLKHPPTRSPNALQFIQQ
ncbi:hypothetical protein, partial [Klebsiella pneumoniae]|uniref:hypothetical protein n=1 Tax=Klebsiella pneumoniae TaxID=573 RepID=UPI0027307B5F